MRKTLILSLIVLLGVVPASLGQDSHPPCWSSELALIEVAAGFYESHLSWLDRVETKEEMLEFASAYLPYRRRAWISSDRCAESIAFTWQSLREISIRAAYKALDFGMRERLDHDPAVLAAYNPLRGALADSFYPERFNREMERIRALAASEERQYVLKPQDGVLPHCNGAELAQLAPLLPPYRRVIDAARNANSIEALLELAGLHIAWRKTWASEEIKPSADGTISASPRDGLASLPACAEAAELLWLMNLTASDKVRSAALVYAGLPDHNNPYLSAFENNAAAITELTSRIAATAAEPTAESRRWTTCTKAQRAALNDRLPAYRTDVLERVSPESLEDTLAYMRSEITWRDELWSSLPKCADAIELALTLSQFAGDMRALLAFWLAEAPVEEVPYVHEAELGEFALKTFGAALTGSSPFREFPARLPDCSAEGFESLSIVLAQYQMYREHMTNFGAMAGLFDVIDPLILWRDALLEALPACREAFAAGLLMSQLADDYMALFGLTFAGYSHRVNPYYEESQSNTQKLAELVETLPIDRGAHAMVWEFGGELDLCNIDEVALLTEIVSEYLDLLDAGGRIRSLEELRAFADSQVAWRREAWPQLPQCAEAFEIGLHIYRSAGDQILFDAPAVAENQLANIIGAESPLSTRLRQIYFALPREWRSRHIGEIESHRRHCSAAERATIRDALAGFRSALEGAVDFEESPVLVSKAIVYKAYVDQRIAWRSEFGAGLPRCLVVFELESVLALNLVESVAANIPVLGAVLSGSDLLQAIAAALAEGDDTLQAAPDYANQMPLCAVAELRDMQQNASVYSAIIEQVPDLASRDALFAYIEAKLAWRAEIWASLPFCAEALQLGFLIHLIASDIATAAALAWHDLDGEANPYIALETQGRDALRQAEQKINSLIESGARRDTAPTADRPLPRCDEDELDDLGGYTFDRGLFVNITERSLTQLSDYIKKVLSWRAETWAPLPACVESVILGGLVSRQIADFANFIALDWAGVSYDENPFMPEIGADASQMAELIELLRKFNLEGIDQFVEAYWERDS